MTKILQVYVCVTKAELIRAKLVVMLDVTVFAETDMQIGNCI